MPKQTLTIEQFHGGLNSSAARTDVADGELTEAIDVMVDELGKVRNMGKDVAYSLSKAVAINNGYGLFRFGHDRVGANGGIKYQHSSGAGTLSQTKAKRAGAGTNGHDMSTLTIPSGITIYGRFLKLILYRATENHFCESYESKHSY